jgi:hypothetical protein
MNKLAKGIEMMNKPRSGDEIGISFLLFIIVFFS